MQPIVTESLKEIEAIFAWLRDAKGEGLDKPTTILVGGWAVYAYNPYFGSIDIDLITSSKTKDSLKDYLVSKMGYERERDEAIGAKFVFKRAKAGRIDVDFGVREADYRFAGRKEALNLKVLDGMTEVRRIGRADVPVPTKSFLLLMKLKAAWDRRWRIENGHSRDPEWEQGKLIKDYADILALVDRERGVAELDIGFLGAELERLGFLRETVGMAAESKDGAGKYGIDPRTAQEFIQRFERLTNRA